MKKIIALFTVLLATSTGFVTAQEQYGNTLNTGLSFVY